jgi:hypothetical protein
MNSTTRYFIYALRLISLENSIALEERLDSSASLIIAERVKKALQLVQPRVFIQYATINLNRTMSEILRRSEKHNPLYAAPD